MKLALELVAGAAYLALVPVTALTTGAEPAAMLAFGTCLLCAGFLRRRHHPPHARS
jgi:hypothetical protein